MATVLVTGGNGMIGRHLCERLLEKGYDVAILSRTRSVNSAIPVYTWDWRRMEIDQTALDAADYIIHLAGENVGEKRWTSDRQQLIIDSRLRTTQLIFNRTKDLNKRLKAFISASAVGFYGTLTSDKIYTETDLSSDDFLGDTCKRWEQSVDQFKELGIRTVKIRTGVVLAREGGALSKMMTPFKMGFGSSIGNGGQYMPWIHIDDLCNIYLKAIEDNQMEGAYNAVAPDHKTNKEFSRILAYVLKKQYWLPPIPAFVLQLRYGKMAKILLKGSRISSEKIRQAGYKFLFTDLESALNDLTR